MALPLVCRNCGDRPAPDNTGLGAADQNYWGGMGPCGDLHQWVVDADLVVTRHAALVTVLRAYGRITFETPIVPHADAATVRGRHVIGVLPLWLAAEAASVTEAQLDVPPEWRGVELSADAVKRCLVGFRTYQVQAL